MSVSQARAAMTPLITRAAAFVPGVVAGAESVIWVGLALPPGIAGPMRAASPRSIPAPAPAVDPIPDKPRKSFTLHIGGNLRLPSRPVAAAETASSPSSHDLANRRDPFAGLPLAGWAERLGARVMPAWEAAQAEAKAAKAAAAAAGEAAAGAPLPSLSVPGFLPFTRWAARSPAVQATLVAPPPKALPKPRLSWWHPDDSMVPRGWWKQGLLADLAYYKPFTSAQTAGT